MRYVGLIREITLSDQNDIYLYISILGILSPFSRRYLLYPLRRRPPGPHTPCVGSPRRRSRPRRRFLIFRAVRATNADSQFPYNSIIPGILLQVSQRRPVLSSSSGSYYFYANVSRVTNKWGAATGFSFVVRHFRFLIARYEWFSFYGRIKRTGRNETRNGGTPLRCR